MARPPARICRTSLDDAHTPLPPPSHGAIDEVGAHRSRRHPFVELGLPARTSKCIVRPLSAPTAPPSTETDPVTRYVTFGFGAHEIPRERPSFSSSARCATTTYRPVCFRLHSPGTSAARPPWLRAEAAACRCQAVRILEPDRRPLVQIERRLFWICVRSHGLTQTNRPKRTA